MMPSQNTGIEMPTSASTVMTRSDSLPARIADTTPTTIPKNSQMMLAPMVSENVAGIPCLICCDDVLLARVRHELAAEHLLHHLPVLHVERLVEAPGLCGC